MDKETYSYVWVTSPDCGGTEDHGESQTLQGGERARAESLTMSEDDLGRKTTIFENEESRGVTSLKDGSTNHLQITPPAPEETGGPTPRNQPKDWLEVGEVEPPVVVTATDPCRVVLDTAVAGSTASLAVRTGLGSFVEDGHIGDCSPMLRRPTLGDFLVSEECGTKLKDVLRDANERVKPVIVPPGSSSHNLNVQLLTPSSGDCARSLPGNTAILTSTNVNSLEQGESRPANEMRGSEEESARPANKEEALSRRSNAMPDRSQDASQALPGLGGHGVSASGCTYTRGGICSIHGPGAKRKWRPVRGEGGAWDKTTKKHYYVCDLSMSARKLKQTKLLFEPVSSPRVEMNRNRGENL